jgi:hypothetical protein
LPRDSIVVLLALTSLSGSQAYMLYAMVLELMMFGIPMVAALAILLAIAAAVRRARSARPAGDGRPGAGTKENSE